MNNEDNYKKEKKKRFIVLLFLILFLSVGIFTVSFSMFDVFDGIEGSNSGSDNTITSGSVLISFSDQMLNSGKTSIKLTDVVPTSDFDGKISLLKDSYFDFDVKVNPSNSKIVYEIVLEKVTEAGKTLMEDEDIKIYLTKVIGDVEYPVEMTLSNGNVKTFNQYDNSKVQGNLGKVVIRNTIQGKKSEEKYRLRMWLKETAQYDNSRYFGVKVNISGYTVE